MLVNALTSLCPNAFPYVFTWSRGEAIVGFLLWSQLLFMSLCSGSAVPGPRGWESGRERLLRGPRPGGAGSSLLCVLPCRLYQFLLLRSLAPSAGERSQQCQGKPAVVELQPRPLPAPGAGPSHPHHQPLRSGKGYVLSCRSDCLL